MRQKVFVNQDGVASFVCPECKAVKRKDVSSYKLRDAEVRLKCRCICGHTYPVVLERRKHIRKEVNLVGTLTSGRRAIPVMVKNLSRSGMQLRSGPKNQLAPGDRAKVEFTLNDTHGSVINREVTIRSVSGNVLGVEFLSDEHYDKLGAYLLYSI